MALNPYIFFPGSCREAIAFYQQTLGAEILFSMTFAEMPPQESGEQQEGCAPAAMPPDAILHATVRVGGSELMMSDGTPDSVPAHHGYALSLSANSLDEARAWFDALSQDGRITMPWQATFWTPGFGMLVDKFGIPWMVGVAHNA